MNYKKLFYLVITAVTAVSIWFTDGNLTLAQFSFDGFENLQILPNTEDTAKAPVVIDGRRIFFVSQSTEQQAIERATKIENDIQDAIESFESLKVTVRRENNYPVIYLNDNYLFTVTRGETLGNETLQTSAEQLRDDIDLAIARARAERSREYLKQRVIAMVLLLAFALLVSRFLDRLQNIPYARQLKKLYPVFLAIIVLSLLV